LNAFLFDAFGNSSSRDHAFGWDAAEAVEEARCQVAELINAKTNEIIFTSGATEAINIALKGLLGRKILTCSAEHAAVCETCVQMQKCWGTHVRYLSVDRNGQIDLGQGQTMIEKNSPGLVCLMLANNETGTIHPIQEISTITHRAGALFFSDLTQAVTKIPIDVRAMGIDLAAFSAHKMYGPKGVGALFVRGGEPQIELQPLIVGGGQQRGLRGGTLNVPGIVGFGEACRIAQLEMREEAARVARLRDKLEQALLAELSDVWINGDLSRRLPNTSNMGFTGVDARTLIRDMHDIAVSTRSACASEDSQGPSHVLKAMGLSDEEAYSCIRFSLGRFTTEDDIDYSIRKVTASVTKLRKN
jgi:cysteine desulfurase